VAATSPTALGLSTAAAAVALATGITSSREGQPFCKREEPVTLEADRLFSSNRYDSLSTMLRAALAKTPEDAEILWRLGRACHKLADAEKPKSPAKAALMREGFAATEKALVLKPACAPAHKWHAILLTEVGELEGTTASIKNSFLVRRHFEKAVALAPDDATARHLLGLWCFEVANLSWMQKKAAAAFFATPPTATFEEALGHFEAAERTEPGFYPKNLLFLAKVHAKLGHKLEAADFRRQCLAAQTKTPEDEETHKQAELFVP